MNKLIFMTCGACIALAGCNTDNKEKETVHSLPILIVSRTSVELSESFTASIRGRQDV